MVPNMREALMYATKSTLVLTIDCALWLHLLEIINTFPEMYIAVSSSVNYRPVRFVHPHTTMNSRDRPTIYNVCRVTKVLRVLQDTFGKRRDCAVSNEHL
jgi:hypothetical protein